MDSMWIVYSITFVLLLAGMLMTVGGIRRLWNKRPVWGSVQGLGGLLLLACGALVLTIGMNLYTYHRLLQEAPVADIKFEQLDPQRFSVQIVAVNEVPRIYELRGDEWQIDVRMLKWQGMATMLGLDPMFRMDRLSGRYRKTEQELNGKRTIYDLGVDHGLDLWALAQSYKSWLPWVDAVYGSAVYMPMVDKGHFQVTIAQSGLVVRPMNDAAKQAAQDWK